jgi:hypothetical protein
MDLDDAFSVYRGLEPRKMACACAARPEPSTVDCGCVCGACGASCRECPGFGYAAPPVKRVHQILSRVRSQIRRRTRTRGHPPGFVRLTRIEIRLLLRKRKGEEVDHWIRDFVDPGPPVRVYDVIVVADRRRE